MIFHVKPVDRRKGYILLSPIYGLNDQDDMPLMNRKEAVLAARYFLDMVDEPGASAQILNTKDDKKYAVQKISTEPNVYLIKWMNADC